MTAGDRMLLEGLVWFAVLVTIAVVALALIGMAFAPILL